MTFVRGAAVQDNGLHFCRRQMGKVLLLRSDYHPAERSSLSDEWQSPASVRQNDLHFAFSSESVSENKVYSCPGGLLRIINHRLRKYACNFLRLSVGQ